MATDDPMAGPPNCADNHDNHAIVLAGSTEESSADALQDFVDTARKELSELFKAEGTAFNYLAKVFDSADNETRFATWLIDTFPMKDDVYYHCCNTLAWVENEDALGSSTPSVFHLISFAWQKGCSLKPSPGFVTCDLLLEQILCDGFVTSGEPLMICQPASFQSSIFTDIESQLSQTWSGPTPLLKVHSLGFIKGQARMQVLYSILAWCWSHDVNLKVAHPKLYETCRTVYAHPMRTANKIDEAMLNMKLSVRGAIRKQNNTIQCVMMVKALYQHGLNDIACFIRKWNSQSPKSSQFQGKKAMSLKLLFGQAPAAVLDDILHHVEVAGWDCAWCSDDNLANKKLYPRFQFPGGCKMWAIWLKTSDESMKCMVARASHVQETSPLYMRRKLDSSDVESLSERAAVLLGMAAELKIRVPVSDDAVHALWVKPWMTGSQQVDLELQASILDKVSGFDVSKVPTLKRIIDQHVFSSPLQVSSSSAESLKVDEFELLLKQLNYDIEVYLTWTKKISTVTGARYFKEQEHKLNVKIETDRVAQNFLNSCCCILVLSDEQRIISSIMDFKRDVITAKLGAGTISTVPLLNWACPCQIPVAFQEAQINVLTWALHDDMNSMAACVCPQFVYSKGKLHLEEAKMMKELSKGHHNFDCTFSIIFKDQQDSRDDRPMTYVGRLVFPSPANLKKHMFYGCQLRVTGRTAEISQLSTAKMKMIEDMAPDALPPSTELREVYVHGAEKYAQIGADAALATLQAIMSGANCSEVAAVLFLDLYLKVGDFAQAFCYNRSLFTCPTFFLGVCESQVEKEWLMVELVDRLAAKVRAGEIMMPNGQAFNATINPDLLVPMPVAPKTNKLIINNEALVLPLDIVKTWQFHPDFGKMFVDWMDKFVGMGDKFLVATAQDDEKEDDEVKGTPLKRTSLGNEHDSPAKKAKIAQEFIVDAASVTQPMLLECKLNTGKDQLYLQLRANHCAIILNKDSAKDHALACHSFVAALGRGTFKLLKDTSDAAKPEQYEFKLSTQNDLVMLNNTVLPIGKVLATQRESKPDAQVCYHKVTLSESDPTQMTFSQTHRVLFSCTNEGSAQETTSSNFASKESYPTWLTSESVVLIWACRWVAKGLMPVKPVLVCKGSIALPPGRCCYILGKATGQS